MNESPSSSSVTNPLFTGYFWLLFSYFCGTVFYVVSKYLLARIDVIDFFYWWYGLALICILIYGTTQKKNSTSIFSIDRKSKYLLALNISLDILATYTFVVALKILDPSIVAFLSQSNIAFVILLGFLFLGEVLKPSEIFAAAIIIAGMLLMTYKSGQIPPSAAALTIFANFLGAASLVIVRKIGPEIGTFKITRLRTVILFLLFLGVKLITEGHITIPPWNVLIVAFLGAAFGPFLNTLSVYKALEYIPAGKLALLRGMQPLPVMVSAAIILHMFPGMRETIGGIVTVGGSLLLAYFHAGHVMGWKTPLRTIRG